MPMTPKYQDHMIVGDKKPHKILMGYECPPCREILENRLEETNWHSCEDIARNEYRLKILIRYKELSDGNEKLPEGYSYP
jgi:hypothetical protein